MRIAYGTIVGNGHFRRRGVRYWELLLIIDCRTDLLPKDLSLRVILELFIYDPSLKEFKNPNFYFLCILPLNFFFRNGEWSSHRNLSNLNGGKRISILHPLLSMKWPKTLRVTFISWIKNVYHSRVIYHWKIFRKFFLYISIFITVNPDGPRVRITILEEV